MTEAVLSLEMNQVRLHQGELDFLMEWSGSRQEKFPLFTKWLASIVAVEHGRRLEGGAYEATAIPLPDLRGAEAADFLMGSYCLVRQPMTESLAKFCDDLHEKIVADCCGYLEWAGEQ